MEMVIINTMILGKFMKDGRLPTTERKGNSVLEKINLDTFLLGGCLIEAGCGRSSLRVAQGGPHSIDECRHGPKGIG